MSVRAFVEYLSLEKNYSPLTCLAYRRDLELFSDFIESNFDGQSVDSVVYPQTEIGSLFWLRRDFLLVPSIEKLLR